MKGQPPVVIVPAGLHGFLPTFNPAQRLRCGLLGDSGAGCRPADLAELAEAEEVKAPAPVFRRESRNKRRATQQPTTNNLPLRPWSFLAKPL